MARNGGINTHKGSIEIWWETGDIPEDAPVVIRAENADNGDVGIAVDRNDGYHVLTYPPGIYTDNIRVTARNEDDTDDMVIAEFTIGPFKVNK